MQADLVLHVQAQRRREIGQLRLENTLISSLLRQSFVSCVSSDFVDCRAQHLCPILDCPFGDVVQLLHRLHDAVFRSPQGDRRALSSNLVDPDLRLPEAAGSARDDLQSTSRLRSSQFAHVEDCVGLLDPGADVLLAQTSSS